MEIENGPASQVSAQVTAPVASDEKRPAAHGVQAVHPVDEQNDPGRQGTHSTFGPSLSNQAVTDELEKLQAPPNIEAFLLNVNTGPLLVKPATQGHE